MEELKKALLEIKKTCPDHYFVVLPDHIKLEEVPEDCMLDAGYIKLTRLQEHDPLGEIASKITKIIRKDTNLKILRDFRDSPPRIPSKDSDS